VTTLMADYAQPPTRTNLEHLAGQRTGEEVGQASSLTVRLESLTYARVKR